MTGDKFDAFLEDIGLHWRTVKFPMTPVARTVHPFVWGRLKEDAQNNQYESWLNDSIQLPDDCQFYRASSNKSLLSAKIGNYHFKGTLDTTVIVDREYAANLNIAGGILVRQVSIASRKLWHRSMTRSKSNNSSGPN